MHPTKHKGRRRARAKALRKMFQYMSPHRVAYTDAALACKDEVAVVAYTGDDNSQVASLRTPIKEEIPIGELVAIALAIIQHPRYIYTDSQDACRAYLRGRTCPNAHHILDTHQPPERKRTISIIWTPSHTETEAFHLAREEASARAMISRNEDPEERLDPPTPLCTFRSITKRYREQQRTLPPPHHLLDKGEQVKWRLLQSNAYPTPFRMNMLYPPPLYPLPACPDCKQARGTIYHMVHACPNHPAPQDTARLRDHPNPCASDVEGERQLISLVDEACRTNGTLDVGTSPG
ncbi:hypothetical protein HPB48_010807 [Haemaphysalis longicornis]|uniref:Tick transposon n=1 Tax=Haemaphysalis longicornis TaxID=44386 RepID=A0A9J6GBY5_HAELO|nr:hypothetical protein HPB48_010807 [Haemaphysalis longicornis]